MSDLPIVCQNVVDAKNLERRVFNNLGVGACNLENFWQSEHPPVKENIHKLPFCVYGGSESQPTRNTEVDY